VRTIADAKVLLEKVAEIYRNLKTYEFDFTLVTEIRGAGGRKSVETQIELTTIRPDKLRMLISGGLGELQVYSDGATSWVFVPSLKQYTRKTTNDAKATTADGASPFAAIAMQVLEQFERISASVHTAKSLRTEELEVEDTPVECLVVEVELEEQDPGEKRVRTYWIDVQRSLVLKVVQFDKLSGEAADALETEITTTFRKADINPSIPDSTFAFSPPADAKEVAAFRTPRPAAIEVGSEAADFQLKDLEGREIQLKGLRGNVVLLNFWASWCGPCRLEMPVIEKLHQQFHGKGLRVFGVNDEDIDTIRDYVSEHEYSFPTLVDSEQRAMSLYRIRGIPTMVVIDRKGKIAQYRIGLTREGDLRSWLRNAGIE
ncbi:MAG TPA: redoxin domain-containing protein, partial [Terriglobia bacterium]|nr:redoxin domain-containing protein [Terriglobia bacterium]